MFKYWTPDREDYKREEEIAVCQDQTFVFFRKSIVFRPSFSEEIGKLCHQFQSAAQQV